MFIGSGGGGGYYNDLKYTLKSHSSIISESGTGSKSGSGGSVIIIKTKKINLNGIITVDGHNGENGEGGGAGGSLIINSTYFYGNGNIFANGGDGGFSGGLISGKLYKFYFCKYYSKCFYVQFYHAIFLWFCFLLFSFLFSFVDTLTFFLV